MALRELRLSASSNGDFLACQRRYQLGYLFGLEADKDKDSTRVGSLWHKCHEHLELKPEALCPRCARREEVDPVCYMCEGTGRIAENRMDIVMRYLNKQYSKTPDNKTADDWAVEQVSVLHSLVGHQWYYSDTENRFEVIGSELKFEVPITKQGGKRRVPKAVFVIKIDRMVREIATGLVYVWERKSTARSLNADYWDALTDGDQVTGYIYGARLAQAKGLLEPYGVKASDPPVAGAFCDVWHKPTIKPKTLSQADTKVLIETGEYCNEKFIVECADNGNEILRVVVNGEPALIIPGKKGFALHETAALYGARLLADITERPEFYFEQRIVARTDQELRDFGYRLPHIAQQIRYVERNNIWTANKGTCTATYRCEFCDLCRSGVVYQPGDKAPPGYRLGWSSTPPIPVVEEIELG